MTSVSEDIVIALDLEVGETNGACDAVIDKALESLPGLLYGHFVCYHLRVGFVLPPALHFLSVPLRSPITSIAVNHKRRTGVLIFAGSIYGSETGK